MESTVSPISPASLRQSWPRPGSPRPIVVIGAGGIVAEAHLPAYLKAGFPVAAIHDLSRERAQALADQFDIPQVAGTLDECLAVENVVFDVAVPPDGAHDVLSRLPDGAAVLIQKPLGRDFSDAGRIRDLCLRKGFLAAVNLQLRFSPMMLALADAIQRGVLGEIVDLEVRLACATPWQLWPFMSALGSVEVPMHSIHYIDWIRSLLGTPDAVQSLSLPHPLHPTLADARTTTILDFGRPLRCALSLNHTYRFGPKFEDAAIMIEGLNGAAHIGLGLLLDYPHGKPETLSLITEGSEWQDIPLQGRWFPDAFVGVMSNLQRVVSGEDKVLATSVEDAFETMAVVEACRRASAGGGSRVPLDDTAPSNPTE